MKNILIHVVMLAGLLFAGINDAYSAGALFNVTASGAVLTIRTTVAHHAYPHAGIQITSSGYSLKNAGTECSPNADGYCLFPTSDTQPATISINGPTGKMNVVLCLDGLGPLSCQHVDDISVTATPPAPSMPGYLYVVDYNSSTSVAPASLCTLNQTTGAILSCVNSGGGATIPGAEGIALNSLGTMAYLTAEAVGPEVYQCSINADGTFNPCSTVTLATPSNFIAYYGTVTLNSAGTIAYYGGYDNFTYQPMVIACPINGNGTINPNCSDTGANNTSNYQIGITLNKNDTTAYLTSSYGTAGLTVCSVNGTVFNNCALKTGGSGFIFSTDLAGTVLNSSGETIYIVDNGANTVYGCSTTANNTSHFNSCFIAGSFLNGLTNVWMIAINPANTVAYISQSFGNNVYVCPIQGDGTFGACTSIPGFNGTFGVVLK